ncbi:tetratricopeptide repeat protein [Paenibacillus prosopidis]|uniref:Tetratricopeptide repeat protein n=1 Tax=Paenibacillus prosopidis TaxID=630520 RepID=A0A368W9S8_9BACL|nr:tetratricopeptide repeat protein [Paenibacillus prosopidis]RCW49532.1 tetratricopeptide repeat protein [Paenibacillus prosopidis]
MAILQAALHRHPDDPEYRYAYGTELYQQQKYDEALDFFLPLLDLHGERLRLDPGPGQTADLTIKAAYALSRTGRTETSIQLLRKGLERYPDHPEMLELLAGLYLENRRPADALSQLEPALGAGSSSAFYTTLSGSGSYRSMHLAGLALEGLWMFGEAAARYSAVLSIRPNYAPSWSRLPQLAMITGQEEQLANLLADLRNRVPPDVWVSILHETIYFRKDDFAGKVWELAPDTIRNRYYPLWEAIILAREDADAASRRFKRLGSSVEAEWYLWAISVKTESENETDLRLPPNFHEPMTEALYRRCQDVLLQVCAWEGVLRWMDRFPANLACPQLPVHRYYAYLSSPEAAIEALLDTARQRRETLTARDGLALGGLAFHAGKLPDSLDWFRYAGQFEPARIEQPAALAYVNLLMARKRLPSRLSDVFAAPDQDQFSRVIRSFMILSG